MLPHERERVQRVFAQARHAGRDPLEYADELGLIVTLTRHAEIESKVLHILADDLEQGDVRGILRAVGRNGNTALDAQRAIVSWIRERARRLEP